MKESVDRNLTRSGKRIVRIAFFEPDDRNGTMLGSVAAFCTANKTGRTFSHVEMMFSDGAVTSVTQDPGVVHYDETRLLSNPRYRHVYEIYINPKEERVMVAFAKDCVRRRVGFNKCAMYWNFIPCCIAIRRNGSEYFCSEYITQMLQSIGYVPDLDPAVTSPNDLYLALKESGVKTGINEKLFRKMSTLKKK